MGTNMKKTLFIISLLVSTWSAFAAIKPGSQSHSANDLYFNYQWPLENSGQVVVGDIDDMTPFETKGVSWANIDWDINLDSSFKRDTVVAVIDSGVDLEHEDLKGRIYLNEKECRDGRVPLGPTGDPDKNGFEGDCAGWNFATPDIRRQRLADDDVGHGTHVAGIIAANVNNGIGLAGLSNRIKILPLKVYDVREGQMPAGTQDVISLRVARAINYAVSRKVDVINLSLGWPIIANIKEVREAIENAEAAGVLVVAAAGNDRHEAQIYPCAFKSVFCVGSINVDGEISRFSNFGGHVDILAPGGQILGLIPMTLSSDFFGMKGYDIKFGTSQAAPYVAGAAAILKGIFPEASNEEIRSALMQSTRKVSNIASGFEVFSSSGLLQIKKAVTALQTKKAARPRPVFKEWDRIILNENSLTGTHHLTFINAQNLQSKRIEVISGDSEVEITWSKSHSGLDLRFNVRSEWVKANYKFRIKIDEEVYEHQLLLVKEIKAKKQVFTTDRNGILENLQTVPTPTHVDVSPRFFSFDKNKKLSIYSLEDQAVKLKFEMDLTGIDLILDGIGLQRLDIDLDGKLDYWLTGIVLDERGQASDIRYVFFNDAGQLINEKLHGSNLRTLKLSSAYSLPLPHQARMIEITHPEWGSIYTPVFLSYGPVEPVDQSTDAFDPDRALTGVHLNFMMPDKEGDELVWKVRSFTKAGLQKKLRSELGLPSWAKFELLTLRLPEENESGDITLLFRTGSGIIQDYYQLTLKGEEFLFSANSNPTTYKKNLDIRSFKTKFDFSNQAFDVAFVLNDDGDVSRQTILKGQFAKDRMRSLLLGSDQVKSQYSYQTQDPREFIASLIKEYHYSSKSVRFYELDTTLEVVVNENGSEEKFSAPIYRTSFVQGSTFSLRFNPMFAVNEKGELAPSLYVDNSALFSPTLYMWLVTETKVYVPVKHSFEIPKECQAMNPAFYQKQPYAVLFCKGQNGPETIELVAF